jgi:hypothetical protein
MIDTTLRNKEGGFFTAAADPSVAARAVTGTLPRSDVRALAALTDGATRWVDKFREGDWADCFALVRKEGAAELVTAYGHWSGRTRRRGRICGGARRTTTRRSCTWSCERPRGGEPIDSDAHVSQSGLQTRGDFAPGLLGARGTADLHRPQPSLLHDAVQLVHQPGQFGHLAAVPVGELADVARPPGLADVRDPAAALAGEVDQPGPAVRRVGLAGDQPRSSRARSCRDIVALPTPM